jgi:hypothetical protein
MLTPGFTATHSLPRGLTQHRAWHVASAALRSGEFMGGYCRFDQKAKTLVSEFVPGLHLSLQRLQQEV